jgi:hypothetical protein
LDSGDFCNGKNIAFWQRALSQGGDCSWLAPDESLGTRSASLRRLVTDVDHARGAGGVEVREFSAVRIHRVCY